MDLLPGLMQGKLSSEADLHHSLDKEVEVALALQWGEQGYEGKEVMEIR